MSKRQFYMLLGVWLIVFPFMGFPSGWDKILSALTGLLLIILAYRSKPDGQGGPAADVPYIEHKTEEKPVPPSSPSRSEITSDSPPLV